MAQLGRHHKVAAPSSPTWDCWALARGSPCFRFARDHRLTCWSHRKWEVDARELQARLVAAWFRSAFVGADS